MAVTMLLQVGIDLDIDRGDIAGRNRIEEFADLIVARDRLDAEEGLRVIVSLTLVELALVLKKDGDCMI